MRNAQNLRPLWHLLRSTILVNTLIFLAVGILCVLAGWRTLHQYGDVLVKVGVGGIFLILFLGMGWNNATTKSYAGLLESGMMRPDEILTISNRENDRRSRFMLIGAIAVVITIAVGLVLMKL